MCILVRIGITRYNEPRNFEIIKIQSCVRSQSLGVDNQFSLIPAYFPIFLPGSSTNQFHESSSAALCASCEKSPIERLSLFFGFISRLVIERRPLYSLVQLFVDGRTFALLHRNDSTRTLVLMSFVYFRVY